MKFPKYHIGDTECYWAQVEAGQPHKLFVMTIRRLIQKNGCWYYSMEGGLFEIEEWPECNIIGKCIL